METTPLSPKSYNNATPRVVVDNVDVERHRSLELVQKTPGVQSRCIGVLTKCDQKQEDSDRWVGPLFANLSGRSYLLTR